MRMRRLIGVCSMIAVFMVAGASLAADCSSAKGVVKADVVAIDQLIMLNRRGASIPEGMVFALKTDLVPIDTTKALGWGNAKLRPGKRPRPIVLRVNQYDCLQITFSNWLSTTPVNSSQTTTRNASVHINGMQVYKIADDGSYVGANSSSLVAPGAQGTYNVYATEEGTFLLYSAGADFGGTGSPNGGAQQTEGLFGAVHVEPPDAEWYRSQVTEEDLRMATTGHFDNGQPKIDYNKTYPLGNALAGRPILKMYTQVDAKTRQLVWSDLTAVITGKDRKAFNPALYPCNNPNGPTADCTNTTANPNFQLNYAEPNRTAPYREFTIIYHELMEVTQALPQFYTNVENQTQLAATTLNPVQDQFAINYGTGGIGAEILANRIGIGPEGGCPDCKYEEFFLDSWTVGDPAMITDVSANAYTGPQPIQDGCTPDTLYTLSQNQGDTAKPCAVTKGTMSNGLMIPVRKAHYAMYPDDPSNVYHSYLNDHVKFRVLHGGTAFSHVHHQHAHQWLRTPNNNESTYLDSQLINPGSSYTLEMTFGGSGNRNKTPGDSIFHCHFYPHFAGGMWALWRVHDTFEPGTVMNGTAPATSGWPRALPDAEILAGSPTPAIVPLPTYAMAPMPAGVRLKQVVNPGAPGNVIGTTVEVNPAEKDKNPGYPFFIPGIAGVRAPHPPMDFAEENGKRLDGGLPRHLLLTGTIANSQETPYDFSKDLGDINAFWLPEEGTAEEQVAMHFHEQCFHMTYPPEGGTKKEYDTNGLKPAKGAPYADPALVPFNPNHPPLGNERCKPVDPAKVRHYRAAVFQTDLVFNKEGWHYPQSRMLSLWEDVGPTLSGDRPPQPLFFRVNTDEATEYWHTNLVPDYYQLDDFQVRTPTDIIGQHIHLVKFDVTSSDGASNGFNYEDGTLSPNEVQARLTGIKNCGGLLTSLAAAAACKSGNRLPPQNPVAPPNEICQYVKGGCPPAWNGAQTTVQRWMADPLKSPAEDPIIDRTLRTVFTHDHFGPSTHQQTGLYAAFVIEPKETEWFQNETGTKMYTRSDGGPTSWEAVVKPMDGKPVTDANTFREFALALQDFQLTYNANSTTQQNPPATPDHPTPPINCDPTASTPTTQCGWADPTHVINQSNTSTGSAPSFAGMSQQGVSAGPTQGTYTFNYRNEPLPYRLTKSDPTKPSNSAKETDPSYVFASNLKRFDKTTTIQPKGGAPINCPSGDPCPSPSSFTFPNPPLTYDMQGGDPFTPMLRAYEKDNVQIRVIVGAHMLPHPFTMQGIKWLFEPGDALTVASSVASKVGEKAASLLPNKLADIVTAQVSARTDLQDNSGFRSTQAMGISEHFEFLFHVPRTQPVNTGFVDYLYMPDSSNPPNTQTAIGNTVEQANGGRGLVDGMWGIMRAYQHEQPSTAPLMPLPNNTPPKTQPASVPTEKPWWWSTVCAKGSKKLDVYAVNASITFNSRPIGLVNQQNQAVTGTITLPTALVYTTNPNLTQATEPLILHANAGDCLEVTLHNNFTSTNAAFSTQYSGYSSNSAFNQVPKDVNGTTVGNGNVPQEKYRVNPSTRVGLNPAVLSYEVSTSSGTNIGFNSTEATVATGGKRTYYWYAGHVNRSGQATPIEFGAVNLMPSDPIQQDTYGLIGALIVEPPNTVFCADGNGSSQAQGTVYRGTSCAQIVEPPLFREFVLVTQDNVGNLPQLTADNNNSTQSTQVALNYKMENMYQRFNNTNDLNTVDLSPAYSNSLSTLNCTNIPKPCTPQTPIFTVNAGMPVRLHMLHPGGASDQQVFAIHGHIFQDEPYQKGSTVIGRNPESPWIGQRDIYGANMAYTILLPSAGGANKVGGDYLYRTHPANFLAQGLWGIICVNTTDHNCKTLYGQ